MKTSIEKTAKLAFEFMFTEPELNWWASYIKRLTLAGTNSSMIILVSSVLISTVNEIMQLRSIM